MRDIEKADRCPAIGPDIVINRPVSVFIILRPFVVWLVCLILGERVGNAFVEDFVSILWSVWPLGTRNRVREAEIIEESRQIVRMELDIELFIDEVLNLLFPPWFALFEQVKELLLLFLVELRGPGRARGL